MSASETLRLVVETTTAGAEAGLKRVEDRASGLGGAFQKLGNSMGNWGIPFSGTVSKMGQDLEEAKAHGQGFQKTLQDVGGIATGVLAVGLAAGAAESIHLAMNMQHADAAIAGHAGISMKAATDIGNAFLSTAGSTIFSGQEMASAYASVAGQLGQLQGHALNAKQALDVMRAAGDLAEASGQKLSDTTSTLGSVMQAFQVPASAVVRTTDELWNTSRATGTSIDSLGNVMDRLKAKMGVAAPSVSDMGSMLVDLADHGVTGSRGLMVVNTAMNSLITPSKQAQFVMGELGLQTFDSSGKFVGFGSIIAQLQPKLAGMTEQQQLQTLSVIMGKTANKALLDTIMGGSDAYDRASTSVNKLGTAHEAAQVKSKTLDDEMKTMKATVEDLGTQWGEQLIPVVQKAGQALASVTGFFMQNHDAAIALATVIGGPLAIAMGAFAVNKVASTAQSIGQAFERVTGAAQKLVGMIPGVSAAQDADAASAGRGRRVAAGPERSDQREHRRDAGQHGRHDRQRWRHRGDGRRASRRGTGARGERRRDGRDGRRGSRRGCRGRRPRPRAWCAITAAAPGGWCGRDRIRGLQGARAGPRRRGHERQGVGRRDGRHGRQVRNGLERGTRSR